MSNEYKTEYDNVIDSEEFETWLEINAISFKRNMQNSGAEARPLREWVKMFLLWSEYDDNKETE